MKDKITTIHDLKEIVKQYSQERDWTKFYSLKNVSMQIATEAAELMEIFLWIDNNESRDTLHKKKDAIEHEIADITYGLINFCLQADIDLATAFEKKMQLNAQKYPIEKAKGNAIKYSEL